MNYTEQLAGARENAELHGYDPKDVSVELAILRNSALRIAFLGWYLSAEAYSASAEESRRAGLSGLVTRLIPHYAQAEELLDRSFQMPQRVLQENSPTSHKISSFVVD